MKTNELVALLAVDAMPVADAVRRRHFVALGVGALAALTMGFLLGAREDLPEAVWLPMFWIKLAFPVSLAAAAFLGVQRLSRPGATLGRVPVALVAPILVTWGLGIAALLVAAPGTREILVFGDTWKDCPIYVGLLALPTFIGVLWAMIGLAPTRPVHAGATAGLLAGATGAAAYAIHCPEMALPFLGVWYLIGMLIPAAVGALIGPRLLRW